MRMKALPAVIILGLLLLSAVVVEPAMASDISWPAEPLISDPTGDAHSGIDISAVYVTNDSDNLYIDVQGPTILFRRSPLTGSVKSWESNTCYVYLNDLAVIISDLNPGGDIELASTCGSVQAPCVLTIPLEQLGGATEINIWVETARSYLSGGWWDFDSDQAPDSDYVTYSILTNQPPVVNSVVADPSELWPPNHKAVPVALAIDAVDLDEPQDIVRITYSVADEYGKYDVAETDLPGDGVISLIAARNGRDKDGRVYTITVTVYDSQGLSDSASIDVVVPHNRRK